MMPTSDIKCVILLVLDGWGIAPAGPGNAIASAHTPNMKRFEISFPHTQLSASGDAVGLPRGEDGNTETGHLNLGAGRIVYQDLARINMSIADGSIFQNQTLLAAIDHAIANNSSLHIMGLIGAGGVHSNIEHLYALIQMVNKKGLKRLFLHVFTDGRDSPPTSAKTYIAQIQQVLDREQVGQIATIMGRYWAMDRDYRWDRTAKAYLALTQGTGHLVKTTTEAIDMSYQQGKTDEFIEPSIIAPAGQPLTKISDNDSVIFFNFRIDRPRQLTRAFVMEDFTQANKVQGFDPYLVNYSKKHTASTTAAPDAALFDRGPRLNNLFFVTMTEYSKDISEAGAQVAFPPESVIAPLGRVIADNNLRQLRAAESEKERFVTYYFNGQQEIAYQNEERLIVPSPKVATYDLKPEMSVRELTDAVLARLWNENPYSFVLINFANADMVGHTGNIGAAVTACQAIDECVGKLASFALAYDAALLITADHGNAEEMVNPASGEIDTEHSNFPVPFIAIAKKFMGKSMMLRSGILADVAPTVLKLLNISPPPSMLGRDLLAEIN